MMKQSRYCSYDNPQTMRREEYYNGELWGWTTFAMVTSVSYKSSRAWDSGQVLGEPFALLTNEELECLP